ncbi:DUF2637 domain-containing protein [Streptomyces griseosporeus]
MTIAATPPTAATAPTVPTTRTGVTETHDRISATPAANPERSDRISAAPAAVPQTPTDASAAPRPRFGSTLTDSQRMVAGTIVALAVLLAGIGLYLSFEHVAAFAHDRLGFLTLAKAQLFTVGVDVGILVLIAIDLLMEWLSRPIRWGRLPVWLLTGATIVLNAASAAPEDGAWTVTDYVATFAHGVVPLLFITVVEIGRSAIHRAVRPHVQVTAKVPLSRWLLAPGPTFAMWRRMKLWALDTYDAAVDLHKRHTVYRVMLKREYGSVRNAPADAKLPLLMAAYGLSVEEALALPLEAEKRAQALRDAEEDARAAEAERDAERAKKAEIAAIRRAGEIRAAEAEVAATTSSAEVLAAAQLAAAERAANAETEAIESAGIAEAKAREAAAALRAAEDRKRAAEIDQDAAETERTAAETRARAAEAEAREEAARAATERARLEAVEAERRAAETAQAAAEARARAAEAERRAVEAEDVARLSPKERTQRKVARMILAAGGQPEHLPISDVAEAFGVSVSTASEYRAAATQLLAEGYRPEGT